MPSHAKSFFYSYMFIILYHNLIKTKKYVSAPTLNLNAFEVSRHLRIYNGNFGFGDEHAFKLSGKSHATAPSFIELYHKLVGPLIHLILLG